MIRNRLDNAQIALLELLKASLFDTDPILMDELDWNAILAEAKAQTVVALAAKTVPEEFVAQWQSLVLQSQAQFVRVLHGQSELVDLFEKAGIPLVILKGTAAAMYYPEPFRRAMGDIDFLVPEDRFEEASALMQANGYVQFSKAWRHAEFKKDGVEYELHHHFSSEGLQVDEVLVYGLARTETNKVCGVSFPALPTLENGFVLLAHAAFHLRSGQLGLRQVIDWMMYAHSCLDDTAWDSAFHELVKKYGLEKLAVTLTYLCKEYLGLPDHVSYIQDADSLLAKELLNVVLSDGNFGRRKGSAQAVERVSNNVRKVGFFHYLQTAGLGQWKAAKRFPVLRPFAWIYYLFCWAKKGKHLVLKPLIIREEYDAGKKLYKLNKQLGLYDMS